MFTLKHSPTFERVCKGEKKRDGEKKIPLLGPLARGTNPILYNLTHFPHKPLPPETPGDRRKMSQAVGEWVIWEEDARGEREYEDRYLTRLLISPLLYILFILHVYRSHIINSFLTAQLHMALYEQYCDFFFLWTSNSQHWAMIKAAKCEDTGVKVDFSLPLYKRSVLIT